MSLWLFDIDGTLIRSAGMGRAALEQAFERLYGWQGVLAGMFLDGMTDHAIFRQVFSSHGQRATPAELSRVGSAYADCLRRLAPTWQGGCVLPGVRELLECLQQLPVTRALLTGNTADGARVKLERYGLADAFVCGAYGDDAERREDLLPVAVRRSALPADAPVVVIGDTPADIAVARAHGAVAVAVATGFRYRRAELAAHEPDLLLDDLRDTEALLKLL